MYFYDAVGNCGNTGYSIDQLFGRNFFYKVNEMMIELGDKVKCQNSGFEGIVEGIACYLNGCRRISVQPVIDKDKKWVDGYWMDETTFEVVKKQIVTPVKLTERVGNLGDWAKCKITGFEGFISHYTEYLYGFRTYHLQPKVDKSGCMQDSRSVHEMSMTVQKKAKIESKQKDLGGPNEKIKHKW